MLFIMLFPFFTDSRLRDVEDIVRKHPNKVPVSYVLFFLVCNVKPQGLGQYYYFRGVWLEFRVTLD